jgi:hypothetical protein
MTQKPMNEKPMIKNIYQRIHAIMANIDYIQKGPKKAAGMYTYVSHDAVSEAIHPLLVKHGVVVIPSVKEMHQDGNRTSMVVTVKFVNIDNPDDCFVVESRGYGIDTGDKGPGKCMSYAVKYALLKTFCLETGDDPDHDQQVKFEPSKEEIKPIVEEPKITQEQYNSLKKFHLKQLESYRKMLLNNLGIQTFQDLLAKDYNNVVKALEQQYKLIQPEIAS